MATIRSYCRKCGGEYRAKFQHRGNNQLPVFIVTCDEGCGDYYTVYTVKDILDLIESSLVEQA